MVTCTNANVGDLVFVRGKGLIPRIVEEFDGRFSHCGIIVSPNRVMQSQGMMRSGIVPSTFKDSIIVDLGLTDEQRQMVYPVAIQLCGYGYDYLQCVGYGIQELLHFRVHNLFNSPNKLICSELVDIYLNTIGWLDDEEFVGDCTPNELYRIVTNKLNRNKSQ